MKTISFSNYLKHLLLSANHRGHGIHSPFLYRLTSMVLECRHPYYCFENQLKDSKKINFIEKNDIRSNEMLFRLVNDFQPKTIWLMDFSDSDLFSWIQQACQRARILGVQSIHNLDFESIPDMVVVSNPGFANADEQDLKFLLSIMPENCIFVFVHKHADANSFKRWKTLIKHQDVTVSMDLFHTGLLFKKKDFKHHHYRIHIH